MRLFEKNLLQKFHELPNNLNSKDYRFFVFTNYAFLMAATFHFVFIFVFALLGLKILSVYNIFSSIIWAICIYLNLKGMRIIPLISANIEIILHAGLCGAILGWESGFHYYILAVPLVAFLSNWPIFSKVLLCTLNGIAYVLLNYYSNNLTPQSIIYSDYVNIFKYINSLSIIFAISYCAYYYRFIVLSVENKLEIRASKNH